VQLSVRHVQFGRDLAALQGLGPEALLRVLGGLERGKAHVLADEVKAPRRLQCEPLGTKSGRIGNTAVHDVVIIILKDLLE
jgi:hypothetical protein